MPNKDPGTGGEYTLYYISVVDTFTDKSCQLTKRYSEFHALYLTIYPYLVQEFTRGMQNLFPDDRVSSWFTRETDKLRNARREYLDGWLRECLLNPLLMLNPKARPKILEFLETEKQFGKI